MNWLLETTTWFGRDKAAEHRYKVDWETGTLTHEAGPFKVEEAMSWPTSPAAARTKSSSTPHP